jgi:predicted Zn-dependent protease
MKQGQAQPPEILSGHPLDANRIQKIKQLMPKALQYYRSVNSK